MADEDQQLEEPRGISRRALFGAGVSRVLSTYGWRGRADSALADPSTARPTQEPPSAHDRTADHGHLGAARTPAALALLDVCGVDEGHRLLEVGAGDGAFALAAATAGARVTAVDDSGVRIARGRERSLAEGVEVTWAETRSRSLAFEDDTFDVVVSCLADMVARRATRVTTDMVGVLRPGGVVGVAIWDSGGWMGEISRLAAHYAPANAASVRPPRWDHARQLVSHLESLVGEGLEKDRAHSRSTSSPPRARGVSRATTQVSSDLFSRGFLLTRARVCGTTSWSCLTDGRRREWPPAS